MESNFVESMSFEYNLEVFGYVLWLEKITYCIYAYAHLRYSVQMSTRGIDAFQYTKKYCVWIKKKPSIAT